MEKMGVLAALIVAVLPATAAAAAGGGGPAAHSGHWTSPPCAGTSNRHCPLGQRADGPTLGNGDLGAMLGGPALGFWLTKNDFWNLAIEASDPKCRYGTYTQELTVPKMTLDTGCTISNGSDTRNSQATAGGLAITPVGQNVTADGWVATQHLENATVQGDFTLTSGAIIHTESFLAAPATALASNISFLVTYLTASEAGVVLNISTSPKGPMAPGGTVESWGSSATASTPAPKDGIRAGQGITVAFATRTIGAATGESSEGGSLLQLAPGATTIVITAVASNIDTGGTDPAAAVQAAVKAATPASIAAMQAAHVSWWAAYWSRSTISLPTQPLVERFWYSSQYTIGSSVRWNGAGSSGVPKTSPGINSIWLIGGEHNGYTIDYNAEAQFYGTASSNRAELTLPWATVVLDYLAAARNESAYFQCPSGLHYPGALGPFGYYNL